MSTKVLASLLALTLPFLLSLDLAATDASSSVERSAQGEQAANPSEPVGQQPPNGTTDALVPVSKAINATSHGCGEFPHQSPSPSCSSICPRGVVQQWVIPRPPPGSCGPGCSTTQTSSCTATSVLGSCSSSISSNESEFWAVCCSCVQ